MELKKASVLGPRRAVFAVKQQRKPLDNKKDDQNPPVVAEYVEELLEERSNEIGDYMHMQTEIDEDMRMSLVGWLVQFHNMSKLRREVIFLGIDILDRYLSKNLAARKYFPLVGLTAMLIAEKYEDNSASQLEKYVTMTDGVYTKKDILDMEKSILRKLGWTLAVPTAYHFLVRFIKAAQADKEMENIIFSLAIRGLMQYTVVKSYPLSIIAAASVYAANCILEKTTLWSASLQHDTGFCESQVMECSKQLVKM